MTRVTIEVISLADDLLNTARDLGDQENIARAFVRLGCAALRDGDSGRALTVHRSAGIGPELGESGHDRVCALHPSAMSFQEGELARATAAYRDSLSHLCRKQLLRPIVRGIERLASAACASEQWQRSARLYAAAAARCIAIGIDFPVSDREDVDTDVAAIRARLTGEQFQSAWDAGQSMSFSDAVAYALEVKSAPAETQPQVAGKLSPREREVLRLIASGQSNKQIAAELFLSVHTIERHITNLYAKIGARGRADATAWALRHDLG